jgi:hypothetical protein
MHTYNYISDFFFQPSINDTLRDQKVLQPRSYDTWCTTRYRACFEGVDEGAAEGRTQKVQYELQ